MVSAYLALASLVLAGMVGAAPLQPRQTCYSGVYMIVGRGSDEAAGEGEPGVVATAVAAAIPDSGSVAVDYPASIFDPPYFDSVSDGITDTINKIESYVNACGASSRIALIGYSQGGNVMTDVLAGGVDKPTPISPSYAKYSMPVPTTSRHEASLETNARQSLPSQFLEIPASRLVSPSTKALPQQVGYVSAFRCVRRILNPREIFARSPGGSSLALLNTYASKIQSYCNTGDEFCASGDSSSVHGQEVADYTTAATNFIVSKN